MTADAEVAGPPLAAVKAMAEPSRWRILELLAAEELCVCHLAEELGVAQPLVSHHLGVLRRAGLIEADRFRYWTYYRLRPDALAGLAERLSAMTAGPAGRARRPCC